MQPDEKVRDVIGRIEYQLARGWGMYLVAKYVRDARVSESIKSLRWLLGITEEASIEAAILAASKIVVSHDSSVTIPYLLDYLEQNPSAFPHIDKKVLREQVASDKKKLDAISVTIEKIKELRDKTIAHLDKRHLGNPSAVYKHAPLSEQEIEQVFKLILGIINHYTGFMKPSEEFTLRSMDSSIADDIHYLVRLIQDDDARP